MGAVCELLSEPNRWCKGWPARDAKGGGCKIDSSKAVAWSLLGALTLYYGSGKLSVYRRINEWLRKRGVLNESGCTVPIGIWASAPERKHGEILELCRDLGL